MTTIHKFTEDTELLSERNNIICISDEAHRSQTNLDQKMSVTEKGVKRSYGFNGKLKEIESYYNECAEEGSSEY